MIIKSGDSVWASLTASLPFCASITRNPFRSSQVFNSQRVSSKSSTTRMVGRTFRGVGGVSSVNILLFSLTHVPNNEEPNAFVRQKCRSLDVRALTGSLQMSAATLVQMGHLVNVLRSQTAKSQPKYNPRRTNPG